MNSIDSLYIHFPYCKHLCNYCDFYKIKSDEGSFDHFQKYFSESFDFHEKFLQEQKYEMQNLKTLYLGGGTPSLWGKQGALFLKRFFKEKKVNLDQLIEATIEVNPGVWTASGLDAWTDMGINRFSVGLQTLDENILPFLDRYHSLQDVYFILEELKKREVNFSVDFMLGLPKSELYSRDIKKELETVLSYDPNHISLYILTLKGRYKWEEFLPEDEWVAEEFYLVSEFLQNRGFYHYEVSNFAKKGFESHHNWEYWMNHSVAALGPSATGYLRENRLRYKWSQKWSHQSPEFQTEQLSLEQKNLEDLYLKLRTSKGMNIQDFFKGRSFEKMCQLAKKWEERELAQCDHLVVRLSTKGFLLMDSLMNDIFLADII